MVQEAAERNVAIPGIAAALESRNISACKDERVILPERYLSIQ